LKTIENKIENFKEMNSNEKITKIENTIEKLRGGVNFMMVWKIDDIANNFINIDTNICNVIDKKITEKRYIRKIKRQLIAYKDGIPELTLEYILLIITVYFHEHMYYVTDYNIKTVMESIIMKYMLNIKTDNLIYITISNIYNFIKKGTIKRDEIKILPYDVRKYFD